MKKYLLIITRTTDSTEFTDFWNIKSGNKSDFISEGSHLLLLNGKEFAQNKASYKTEAIIEIISTLNYDNSEIGILYHNTKKRNFEMELKSNLSNFSLTFIEAYSSTDNNFFDEKKAAKDFIRPLNKLSSAIGKNPLDNDFIDGLNAVWSYKFSNDILDAKLELLCLLAKEKGKNAESIWVNANKIASLEKYQTYWKSYLKNNDLNVLSEALFAEN